MIVIPCVILIVLTNNVQALDLLKDDKSFGPYTPEWTDYESCKGPRARNGTNFNMELVNQRGYYIATLYLDILFQLSIDELKVWVYKMEDSKKNPLWVYKIGSVCRHFIFAEIVKREFKTNSCLINKGSYNITLNFTKLAKNILGPSFFYGTYSMKAVVSSKQFNFMCCTFNIIIHKKSG